MTAEFLVIGATGRHGGTGGSVARALIASGQRVRALARGRGPGAEALEAQGAEVVIGDLRDRKSLEAALDGVRAGYFTFPVGPGIVEAAANYAAAAKRARIEHTVVMSMAVAHPDSPSCLGRAQWLAEEVIAWSGATATVLRYGALFLENLITLHARSIRTVGKIRNNFGPAPMAWIAGADAAAVAAKALLDGPMAPGVSVRALPGAFQASHDTIAAELSALTGRRIAYESIPRSAWREELIGLAQAESEAVINPHMADHISSVASFLAAGARTAQANTYSQSIADALGREPIDLASFLRTNLQHWGQRS